MLGDRRAEHHRQEQWWPSRTMERVEWVSGKFGSLLHVNTGGDWKDHVEKDRTSDSILDILDRPNLAGHWQNAGT